MSDRVARVAVVVPARDEQLLVGSCLAALLTSRDHLRRSRPDVVVDLLVGAIDPRVADGAAT